MNDNLPPLPPCAPEFKPRWPNDPGGYKEDQMKAYARAALAAAPQPSLWAIHVPGPDDYYPAPSEDAAKHMAAKHNAAMTEYYKANPDTSGHRPPIECALATAAMWPGSAADHAEEVAVFDYAAWGLAAPQPQPVQQPVAWSERIKELADQYAIECVEFSKGIPNGAHSMSPIAVKAGDTRLALHSAIDTAERFIRAIESATLAAQVERAPQPQPVQQEPCPECDGTGTVAGSQAHFPCPLCTSPQAAQPLSDADVQQISRALHHHGLTLVRTAQGFGVMKLGEITAYAATKGTT